MGYTHYWRGSKIDADTWARITKDVRRVLEISSVPVAGYGGRGDALVCDESIALNGVAPDDDYESFVIDPQGTDFDCTKTARRPYDVVVTAILCIIAHHTDWTISSDGTPREWRSGVALAQRVDAKYTCPITE